VIGPQGEQLGILQIEQALTKAAEAGMNLVEVNPMAKPPVCKIMDYGKFKYEEKKKKAETRKNQVVQQLKEVKLRPKTEEHDYAFKVKNIRSFLQEGDKARVTIMFRGREITHRDIGQRILQEVVEDVRDCGIVEQQPRLEGRQMFMILSPNPKWKPGTPAPPPRAHSISAVISRPVASPSKPAAPLTAAPTGGRDARGRPIPPSPAQIAAHAAAVAKAAAEAKAAAAPVEAPAPAGPVPSAQPASAQPGGLAAQVKPATERKAMPMPRTVAPDRAAAIPMPKIAKPSTPKP
jgi:translation initiation factor IF-3